MDDSGSEHGRESQWARGLGEDDPEVFEDLFRTLYADLVAYAQSVLQREDVAESVVQEVFLQLWKRDDWDASDDVTAYAYRSVHNRVLNAVRDRRPQAEEPDAHSSGSLRGYTRPDQRFNTEQLRDDIEETIESLPHRRRQIFLLSRRHGLTYAQIADVFDISERTVETQIRRALQALRECAEKYK